MAPTLEKINEDPAFTGPRPTPTIPNGGSYSVYNKVIINAPPEAVLKALICIAKWKDWNKFVPTVTVEKTAAAQDNKDDWVEGEVVTFHCRMDNSDSITKSKEKAVQIGPLLQKSADKDVLARTVVRWISQGMPSFVVKAEHVNWIDDNGDGTSTYQHWETFSGYAVPMIKTLHGKSLHENFIAWADDLKAYVEGLQSASPSTA